MGAIPLGSPCAYGSRSGGDYSTKYQACNSLGGERRRKGCESAVKGPALETLVLSFFNATRKKTVDMLTHVWSHTEFLQLAFPCNYSEMGSSFMWFPCRNSSGEELGRSGLTQWECVWEVWFFRCDNFSDLLDNVCFGMLDVEIS